MQKYIPFLDVLSERNNSAKKRNDDIIEVCAMHTPESRLIGFFDNEIYYTQTCESRLLQGDYSKVRFENDDVRGVTYSSKKVTNFFAHFKIIDSHEKHSLKTLKIVCKQLKDFLDSLQENNAREVLNAEQFDYLIPMIDTSEMNDGSKAEFSTVAAELSDQHKVGLAAEEKFSKYFNKVSNVIITRMNKQEYEMKKWERNPFYSFAIGFISLAMRSAAYNIAVARSHTNNRSSFWFDAVNRNATRPSQYAAPAKHEAQKLFCKPFIEYFTEDTRNGYFL